MLNLPIYLTLMDTFESSYIFSVPVGKIPKEGSSQPNDIFMSVLTKDKYNPNE